MARVVLDTCVFIPAILGVNDLGENAVYGEITRRDELREAWSSSQEDVNDMTEKTSRLHASIALSNQRGKRLDPSAAKSVTECENLLTELLREMKRYDVKSEGGTQQIDQLIKKINDLHIEIESALEV